MIAYEPLIIVSSRTNSTEAFQHFCLKVGWQLGVRVIKIVIDHSLRQGEVKLGLLQLRDRLSILLCAAHHPRANRVHLRGIILIASYA